MAMRVLVQNGDTGLFLKSDKLWTNQAVEARDFGSSLDAIQQVIDLHLRNPDIVLSFGDPKLDLKISLGNARAA
jgi:hypothetical protein